ncbi:MAG TPA: gephyrin-like molybdotransferase Glp [Xanthobacteraceae bacterium]|nr:gephyrin-like molybdotransferase Glp [Xanthobacteraceae bacterium]
MALLSVADALERVLAHAEPLPAEEAPLAEADGRVLVYALKALRTQPPADVSAMDGYAVRADDVEEAPVRLKIIGEVAAGRPFTHSVGHGEAARIFTGGVIPPGADTVVIQELSKRDGDFVEVEQPTAKGRHIRVGGLDFKAGDLLLNAGHRLSARDLALAAAMNHPLVPVHRRPKVALFATGDELVPPGTEPGPGQIVSSNTFALAALARGEGAEAVDLGIVRDRLDDTIAVVRRARELDADILVTSGGASVGDYDLVQPALAAEGMALSFWKLALRPGRPLMHGRLGTMHVLGVPGNPVSAFICAFLFLVPLIRRLAGRSDLGFETETATLAYDLPANDERADYLRATLSDGPRGPVATPFPIQDSSMMAPLAKADCLIVREPYARALKAGSRCAIVKFDR